MYTFLPSTATLLFIVVMLLCQLLTMKHQIGRLSAAYSEPSCILTITFSETFSICMYENVKSVHYVHLDFRVQMCHEVSINSI